MTPQAPIGMLKDTNLSRSCRWISHIHYSTRLRCEELDAHFISHIPPVMEAEDRLRRGGISLSVGFGNKKKPEGPEGGNAFTVIIYRQTNKEL